MTYNDDYNDIPWDKIPRGNYMPASIVKAELESLTDELSQSDKRMFVAVFNIIEPIEFRNRKHTERYTTGTNENPGGFDGFGATNLNRMRIAAQIRPMGAREFCEFVEVERPQVLLQMKEPKPTDDFQNNSIANYYRIGEEEPRLLDNNVKKTTNRPAARRPQQRPSGTNYQSSQPAPPADTNDQSYQPAQKTQPQSKQELPPVETYENTKDASPQKEELTERTQTNNAAPSNGNTAETFMIPCNKCGKSFPASEIGAHMAMHFQQGAE